MDQSLGIRDGLQNSVFKEQPVVEEECVQAAALLKTLKEFHIGRYTLRWPPGYTWTSWTLLLSQDHTLHIQSGLGHILYIVSEKLGNKNCILVIEVGGWLKEMKLKVKEKAFLCVFKCIKDVDIQGFKN